MRLDLESAIRRYGPIEKSRWENESRWCEIIQVPLDIGYAWINPITKRPTLRIYCNKDMAMPLLRVFQNIRNRNLISELKTFDGCFNIRDVRGESGKPSCHSYALAIDINAETNPLGSDGDLSQNLAQCFIDEGFTWGKQFSRKDPQHFSFAWE